MFDEYWGVIIFAAAVTLGAMVFLYLSRVSPSYVSVGALVGARRACTAPMTVTAEGRLVVRVNGEHDFVLDTAYDFNGITEALDEEWTRENVIEPREKDESVTIMTSHATRMALTSLPPTIDIGPTASGRTCSVSIEDVGRTIVLGKGTLGGGMHGILGRAFLESSMFSSVTLVIPPNHSGSNNGYIKFNMPPPNDSSLIARTTERDPRFGLFVLPVTVLQRGQVILPSAKFVVDTGAARLVVETNHARKVMQREPRLKYTARESIINMSGNTSKTRIQENLQCIVGSSNAAEMRTTAVSFVTEGVAPNTVLNREDGIAGLLGTNCLRGMTLYLDNERDSLSVYS